MIFFTAVGMFVVGVIALVVIGIVGLYVYARWWAS